MLYLSLAFFITALIYAIAGFGGGSTYTALLAINNIDYRYIPIISLSCNLIVVSGGCWYFIRKKIMQWRLVLPLVIFSVPMAWLGGSMRISQQWFFIVLGCALFVSGIILLFDNARNNKVKASKFNHYWLGPSLGMPLGLLAGISGIGGGIFLVPILHHLRLASAKVIAAAASFFILVNSLAGLTGQLNKFTSSALTWQSLLNYSWLLPAVFIGGQIGSRLNVHIFTTRIIKRVTAILVLIVAIRLLWISFF